MADPVVTITNGVPTAGTGTITTLGQTLVDGANATIGITTGAAVTTSAAGTLQQYLRGIVSLLVSGITVTSHAVTNAGTFAVQATLTAGALVLGKVGIDQTTDLTTNKVRAFIHDGTTALPILAASSGAPAATVPAIPVSIRDVNANVQGGAPVTVGAVVPTVTANGATSSRVKAAASTNATSLKASAGQIYSIDFFNNAIYAVYFKLYNKASAPTVGTDTPVWTIPVAAGGGFSREFPRGKTFATGIAYAITKLEADSDTTVVVADDLTGSLDWI